MRPVSGELIADSKNLFVKCGAAPARGLGTAHDVLCQILKTADALILELAKNLIRGLTGKIFYGCCAYCLFYAFSHLFLLKPWNLARGWYRGLQRLQL